ncbi:MAG TPA: hypothetical protein PK621_03790, partial [Syntrophales bacterium]|nr:hypothetical protein [Syntrophales bacterium]
MLLIRLLLGSLLLNRFLGLPFWFFLGLTLFGLFFLLFLCFRNSFLLGLCLLSLALLLFFLGSFLLFLFFQDSCIFDVLINFHIRCRSQQRRLIGPGNNHHDLGGDSYDLVRLIGIITVARATGKDKAALTVAVHAYKNGTANAANSCRGVDFKVSSLLEIVYGYLSLTPEEVYIILLSIFGLILR